VGNGCGVLVGEGVNVFVGVGCGVSVEVGMGVFVGEGIGVSVAVGCGVLVETGVFVAVGKGVSVAVVSGVGLGNGDACVGVGSGDSDVGVSVGVGVLVGSHPVTVKMAISPKMMKYLRYTNSSKFLLNCANRFCIALSSRKREMIFTTRGCGGRKAQWICI
jgi:hypothetical protein